MITVNKAYEIVKQHNPNMKASSCYEFFDCYAFGLEPVNMDADDRYANSCAYTVDKSNGNYKVVHFMDMPSSPSKEIDVKLLTR